MELAARNAEQLSASARVDVKPETPPAVVQNVNSQKPTLSSCYRCCYEGLFHQAAILSQQLATGAKIWGTYLEHARPRGKVAITNSEQLSGTGMGII